MAHTRQARVRRSVAVHSGVRSPVNSTGALKPDRDHRTPETGARKERITISVTKDTAKFLKAYCARVRAPSRSALVEEIITDRKRSLEMKELNAQVAAYYDSLSTEQRREEAAWGEFAETERAGSEW